MEALAQALAKSIRAGNRRALSKALTLTESTKREHQILALELLNILSKDSNLRSGQGSMGLKSRELAFSIGISGPPGAGKSSLIDTLGFSMVQSGSKVAVLAIDPSSESSGGAILGDKTRMSKYVSPRLLLFYTIFGNVIISLAVHVHRIQVLLFISCVQADIP